MRKKLISIFTILAQVASLAAAAVPAAAAAEEPELAAWYPLSADVNDVSGNGYDGTIGGNGYSFDAESGSLHLDGGAYGSTAGYVELPGKLFAGHDTLTIASWIKNETGNGNYSALFFGTDASNGLPVNYWLFNPANPQGYVKSVFTNSNNTSAPWSTEVGSAADKQSTTEWAYYVTVISEDSITLYVDGEQISSKAKTKSVSDFGDNLKAYIGKSVYHDKFYQGNIKDLRVYYGALSDIAVAKLYEDTQKLFEVTDERYVEIAKQNLKINGTDPYVTGNITLASEQSGCNITWESSDENIISSQSVALDNEISAKYDTYSEIPAGVVNRQGTDTEVTLTATISKGDYSDTKEFNVTVKAAAKTAKEMAADGDFEDYFYAYFRGDANTKAMQQVYAATSTDGLNWKDYNNTAPILTSSLGTGGLRDHFIVRAPEGDKFYLLCTDLDASSGQWKNFAENGSKSIMVWESEDLVNWSDQRMVKLSTDDMGCTWAPETIYDEITGEYVVYWSSHDLADEKKNVYWSRTRDFYTFTEPQIYVSAETGAPSAVSTSYIDSTMIEGTDGKFYRITKYEDVAPTQVFMEVSDAPLGEFTEIETNLAADDFRGTEGPAIFKFNDRNEWCLMLDGYNGPNSGVGFFPSTITDLSGGQFSRVKEGFKMPTGPKHGVVVPITAAEYEKLIETEPEPTEIPTTAPTPEPIPELTLPTANVPAEPVTEPVLWYDFSDVSGYIAKDKSGNGNDGIIPEGAGVSVKAGNAIALDGEKQYVQIPDNITDTMSDFTVSVWMKNIARAGGIHNKPLFDFGGKIGYIPQANAAGGYNQGFNLGGMIYTPGNTAGTGSAETSSWNHLTITQRSGKATLYINGKALISKTMQTPAQLAPLINNFIGTSSAKKTYYPVEIDEFKLYNRSLNEIEVIENGFDALATDEEKLNYAVAALNIDTNSEYKKNIELPIGDGGELKVSWQSSDTSVVTNNGIITRPQSGTAKATLTANISVGSKSTTKSFDISVANIMVSDYTLDISSQKGVDIDEGMIGLFFEDINYAADGGLYAEMIENRSFEQMKSSAWSKNAPEPQYKWSAYPANGSGAAMEYVTEGGIHENNPTYLSFTGADTQLGFSNHGYDGLNVRADMTYNVSFWAKADNYSGSIKLSFVKDGKNCGETTITDTITEEWKKYEGTIKATDDARYSDFVVELTKAGNVKFDMISCIPGDAVCGVFRKDLAQMLKDIKPGFLRFPGGCIIEGYDLDNRYQWKKSVGGVETRKQNWTRWATHAYYVNPYYNQSLGIGYYEYFLLCEYLEAKAVPVVNVGMACQYNTHQSVAVDSDEFKQYVQDALDLIEFANSTDFENSEWARLRRDMGHEAPFNLELIGIGNEQWEEVYNGVDNEFHKRYELFEKAIHEKYPEMGLINTASAFMKGTGAQYEAIWTDAWNWIREKTAENPNFQYAVDEHYYMTPDWFYNNVHLYDSYDRNAKVFAGEYAARLQADSKANNPAANTLNTALSEAAFMTGFEKNADVVKMASAAPLFARLNYTQWSPDLIWFDDDKSYGTPNYYVQKMYGNNQGDYTLESTLTENSNVYESVVYDEKANEIIIKLINRSDDNKEIKISIDRAYNTGSTAEITCMSGSYELAVNSIDNPENIIPVTETISGISNEFVYNIPKYAFSVLRIPAKVNGPNEQRKNPQILTGEVFGYTQAADALPEYAFDDNTTTFYDAAPANGQTGIKLDSAKNVSKIEFYPRTSHSSHPARICNGIFEGSTDGETWESLYTVPSDAKILSDYNVVEEINNKLKTYTYLRYRNPVNWNSIAEIRFYTEEFTAPYVAANIECVKKVAMDIETLPMPYVPDGFSIAVNSSDNDAIGTDGSVKHTSSNQTAKVVFAITNKETGAVALSDTFEIEIEANLNSEGKAQADLDAIEIEDAQALNHSLFLPIGGEYGSEISWISDNPAIKLTKEADKWTAVITRPQIGDIKVTLTASASNGDIVLTKSFDITITATAQDTGYLFVSHGKDDEAVYFSLSRDGHKFDRINNNEAVIRNTGASLGVRDPFVLRGEDGYFYIIGTEMKAANGWKNKNFVTWKSADLVNWTDQTIIPVVGEYDLTKDADVAWAPEAIYDPDKDMYMIYWSNGKLNGQYMCGIYTRDFKTLEGEPFVLYKDQSGNNKPVIDGNIIKVGNKYYMYIKDENTGGLCRVECDTLNGEYKNLVPILQNGELGSGKESVVEGSSIYQLIDEPSKYAMVYDHFQVSNYGLAETTDFENFTVLTGTEGVKINAAHQPSHGNVIRLEEADFQRLNKAYGKYEFAAKHLLGGKYADPDIQVFGNKFYIFPTSDGYANWSGTYFKAFSSTDMVHWTDEGTILDLNDVSWASSNAWAPCMAEKNGKYYFYYTAEKQIGVAVADSPTGPFTDLGKPLVTGDDIAGIGRGQVIDPYVLTDDNGKAYLYFGNQNMFAVELGDDMTSLKGEIRNITPSDNQTGFIADQYMEGTCVTKINGKYYFSWSCNGTTDENYHVKYGISDSPMGPIVRMSDGKENAGDVLLEKKSDEGIYGAGHHSIVKIPGKKEYYIAYHRFYMPGGNGYNREVCIDKLTVNEDGTISVVVPTTAGIIDKVTYDGFDKLFVTTSVEDNKLCKIKLENLNSSEVEALIYAVQYKDGIPVSIDKIKAAIASGEVQYIDTDIEINPDCELKLFAWDNGMKPLTRIQ